MCAALALSGFDSHRETHLVVLKAGKFQALKVERNPVIFNPSPFQPANLEDENLSFLLPTTH